MAPEAKVGALFLVAVLLITGVVLFLGQYTSGWGQYELVIHFAEVQGLAPGTEVRLAGVKIGKVVRVELEEHEDYPEKPVAVYVMIRTHTNLYDSDEFVIEQAGFIGDQYLSVRRLTTEQVVKKYGQDYRPKALGPGEHHAGTGLVGLAKVTEQTQQLLAQANETLGQIQETFADAYTRDQIRQILLNVNNATAKANLLAERALHIAAMLSETTQVGRSQITVTLDTVAQAAGDLKATSGQIRGVVRALAEGPLARQMALSAANIHRASDNIRATTETVREVVAGQEDKPGLQEMLDSLAAASENVEKTTAAAAELVGDEQVTTDLKTTLGNLRATSQSLRAISARVEEFVIEEETLGSIQSTLRNVQAMSEEGAEVTATAGEVLDRVDRTMDRLGELAQPLHPYYTDAYWDLEATEDVGLRGDLNLSLQYGQDPLDYWRLGVRDVGDQETLILQKSLRLGPRLWGQAGILKSKVSAGLNYQMTPDLRWQAEAYDPDDTHVDLRGIYRLTPEWHLTLGLADSFDEKKPFVGVRHSLNIRSEQKDKE